MQPTAPETVERPPTAAAAAARVYPVSEVFGPVCQGEGPLIGRPTVFVRFGGCDYQHCSWCDSLHAVLAQYKHEWTKLSCAQIMERVTGLAQGPLLVTLSGGNPALYDLGALITAGKKQGYTFALETQGSRPQAWFVLLDHVILSPKPPSSGMVTDWEALARCVALGQTTHCALKVVVNDEADYQYARRVHARFPHTPCYLQTCNDTPPQSDTAPDPLRLLARLRALQERALVDGWYDCIITPQLHVLLYQNERGR